MTRRDRRVIAVLLALFALTAGCTGAGGGGDSATELAAEDGEFQGESADAATSTPAEQDDAGNGGDSSAQQFADRQLILTGQVAVEVQDFDDARTNLTEATERYGGFVSDTSQSVNRLDNESWSEGTIVLRVPRENFTVLYDRAKSEGELLEADRESQDVTDQLVDIRARLDNLRAERDRLRELYQRANDTEDVLRVQRELSDVQEEIERLEARQQSLRERVALATITVRLHEPRPEPERRITEQWYDVPLVAAFLESVDGVAVTLRAIAVGTAYALPYVVVFGVPLVGLSYVVRRRRGGGSPGRVRRWLAGWRSGDSTVESRETDAAREDEPNDDGDDR